jgi:diguanylate cyclase (GGDEF)-like protein
LSPDIPVAEILGSWFARFTLTATSRIFATLLLLLLVVLGLSTAEPLLERHAVTSTASTISDRGAIKASVVGQKKIPHQITQAINKSAWINTTQGISLVLCAVLCGLGIRLRNKVVREARGKESVEFALERRVEQRTRELRQEVEDRRLADHLNRGQKQILEMLAEPGDLQTDDILRYLTATVASRNQGWECSLHLVEPRGKGLYLVASSEVNEKLEGYLDFVGNEFPDTPECQACASGETHIVEHLSEVGLSWSNLLVSNGIFSAWSIPFCSHGSGRLAGTLTVYARSRCKPSPRELEMVESAAKLAGLILEHRRLHTELVHNAMQDPLTGLPNRRAGEEAIEEAIKDAKRRNESVAVLWVDINRFKRVNDQYGHDTGNHVLRTIAERLRRNPLSTGTVARMGEDEFLVLVPGTQDSLDSVEMARRLAAAIARPIYAGSAKISVSASVGICVYPQDGATLDILERNAEFAMYRAKDADEAYCVFTTAMSDEARETMEIEEALSVALERNYLRLAYQPLYAQDGELTGFEALLRFQHPRLGNVSPARFIPIAEETRLIVPIGNWVLGEACRQLKEWHNAGLPKVRMAVNISVLQFARDDFADSVADIFSEHELAPEHLILELTESVVMEDYQAVVRQMNLLRQCGVHIAMDDFGTGYSSLSYIHRIPVDVLKIDRSFVERLEDPEGTRPIVEAVISMARHLGLNVVAEGVETKEQQNILQLAGCHGFQGFLFARPLPPDQAELCLKASRTIRFANATSQTGGDLAVA